MDDSIESLRNNTDFIDIDNGIVDRLKQDGRRYQVKKFVEKPEPGTAPSNLAIMGRYVLTPEIFNFLEMQEIGAGGEIQLTDAITKLNEIQRVFAYDFKGKRYDVGEKLGFITTTIDFALKDEALKDALMKFMKEKVGNGGGLNGSISHRWNWLYW